MKRKSGWHAKHHGLNKHDLQHTRKQFCTEGLKNNITPAMIVTTNHRHQVRHTDHRHLLPLLVFVVSRFLLQIEQDQQSICPDPL